MLARQHDPIIAIATAPGRGSVGIVRISGKDLRGFAQALFGRTLAPRQATYLPFTDADGSVIDKGLALYFAGPHSFTGEDVLELQGHGGPVVLQLVLARCMALAATASGQQGLPLLPGLRLAQPGEFSERAFLNDKLDLAQAEAIADLIDASTEAAARSASQSMTGVFSQRVHSVRDALIDLRMLVEATLDFPEEEIDFLQKADAQGQLQTILALLDAVLGDARQGALLREGIRVVIAGQPNVGKSSLLNALAGAELAIVTPIAGTTRDKVEQTIQIEGVPIHVIDTAGLRDSSDTVEQIGIARAWDAIATADAVVFLRDLSRSDAPEYVAGDADIARAIAERCPQSVPVLQVWNKVDTGGASVTKEGIRLSAKTLEGLQSLRQALLQAAGWQGAQTGSFMARERHLQALRQARQHAEAAAAHLQAAAMHLDLMAEELRLAQVALGEITGEFTSDDLLGVIFSRFCIGK
ncbi:tRNA uridine-5-carboxymethylaminomethyl(34) synthesis GTPase MnmE [Curvibacter sp. APW13]|uniref:tRNA uridine-5-carboxymethylaminomethyl(34) synthesis GTPase MnmE n=1 Tax=Curvibacter sp. APW13 TaxID=3077236 RepID=UPI0028E06987|nr:tRNA uridine-5-carboxymethylaminomethyl(34) synthesis GTPase MnmE [Curvibacter sp. APW13]MDT8990394.1 tRNA uridine-5-carboxymethylaminomethyl(34) synthesis GTPase MnmE [Curvibacter sp. APW13]